MSKNSLIITIEAHSPYIRHTDRQYRPQMSKLFSAISETYLPLLRMFSDLESDGIPFRLGMAFSPVLCAMLSDPLIQDEYVQWLDDLAELGQKEVKRYESGSSIQNLARGYLKSVEKNRLDFTETYGKNILSKFNYYAVKGNVELLAGAATHCYLPLYTDLPEAVNAQIEAGLISHRTYFETIPDGFWLPEMGYQNGLEQTLKSYGLSYTILNVHGLLFADPVPEAGIFSPVRCGNGFSVFGRDVSSALEVYGTPDSCIYNSVYRNQDRDIGYDSPMDYISGFLGDKNRRIATGFKYWARGVRSDDRKRRPCLYDKAEAVSQAQQDARDFLDGKEKKLAEASRFIKDGHASVVCAFPAELFGQQWYEGIEWLETVLRETAERENIECSLCSAVLGGKMLLEKVTPFFSSSGANGYSEELLDNSNDWMIRYARKAVERMIDLTERFPNDTGLKERALNLGARELLLALADDWPRMVHDHMYDDYAAQRFRESIFAFTTVYDSLGSNFISTEWLTSVEKEHPLFPWLNYRIFSRKK